MQDRPGQRVQTTDEFYAWCAVSGIALLAALELSYLAIAQSFSFAAPSIDPFGYAVGRDFINSWMGGRSAFSGGPAPWFDVATYNAALRDITGRADFPTHFWSYPPHLVLLLWPLGLLPYLPAYVRRYPFILMDCAGLPWRGRSTYTPDQSSAASAAVASFLGTAAPSQSVCDAQRVRRQARRARRPSSVPLAAAAVPTGRSSKGPTEGPE